MSICRKRKTYKELLAENAALKKENKYLRSLVSKNKERKNSVPRFKPPMIVGKYHLGQNVPVIDESFDTEKTSSSFKPPITLYWP